MGLRLHLPRLANFQRRQHVGRMEPVGGERMYRLRPIQRINGQKRKTMVGRV